MTHVIDMRDVQFGWSNDHPLLGIDRLVVGAGERVFVHGPSGSGKSSLLGLLAGVTTPQRGTVSVLGTDIARLTPAARDAFRANHFGIIFQMFNLLPYLSIVQNVTLPCRFSAPRRTRAGERGGMDAEAQRLLSHLDLADVAASHRAVTQLSVGQQQRVAAARALIGSPEVVLADEPTSALDTDRREAFLRLLFAECAERKSALVFVSHDAGLKHLFDRTIALADINTAVH